MAGTVTVTTSQLTGGVTKYSIAWTSDGAGAVNTNRFDVRKGELLQVKFVPGTGGTVPTALYDVTLVDTDSVDVLAGLGTDLSATAAAIKVPLFGSSTVQRYYHDASQQLDLVVANAGAAKTGTVVIWVR